MTNYSPAELMTINAARLLRDGDVVFVGVGLPNLACNLARRTHAPNLVMVYEAGVVGAQPARLPLSIGDPTLVSGAAAVVSMFEIFAFYLQRGLTDRARKYREAVKKSVPYDMDMYFNQVDAHPEIYQR